MINKLLAFLSTVSTGTVGRLRMKPRAGDWGLFVALLARDSHPQLPLQPPPPSPLAPWTASLALWLRRQPRERKIRGSDPACDGIFSGSSHTSDFKIGTPLATLPGAWRYTVSAGTGRPGVSILRLGEVES